MQTTDRIEGEADAIRRHLDDLLSELDRRRRSVVATSRRVTAYGKPVLFGALALGVVTGLVVRYARHRIERGRRLEVRAARWWSHLTGSLPLRRLSRLM